VDREEAMYSYEASGSVAPGESDDGHKWTYREGLTQLAKRLVARTDATVHRRTRIETIRYETADTSASAEPPGDGYWRLVDSDGESWGPFDVLLLNPPAPQTATLLEAAAWSAPVRKSLAEAAASVPYRTIWTAVLHYEFALEVPYYGLINVDREHEVGWISREECKPGHVPTDETLLIVQAAPDWSVEHYDDPPGENVAALADHAADVIGDDRLRSPAWTDHQRWRYALPDEAIDSRPLRAAEAAGLYCAGDWVVGEARLHAALANGLDIGQRIAEALVNPG
jgi:predicted NAD/FAD-dependent oxidoreductase